MRDKKNNFTLPMWQAEQVLDSPNQLVKISENGEWNGLTVNKADVAMTDRDREAEKEWRIENTDQLQAPEERESLPQDIESAKDKIRLQFKA